MPIAALLYENTLPYVDAADLEAFRENLNALLEPHLTESPGKERLTLSVISLPDV